MAPAASDAPLDMNWRSVAPGRQSMLASSIPSLSLSAPSSRFRKDALLLYGAFLGALLLDVGGALGLKYAVAVVVAGFVILNLRAIRVPRSALFVEGTLFGIAPALFLTLSVAYFGVPAGVATSNLTYLSTWVLFPLLLLLPRADIIRGFTAAMHAGAIITLALFAILVLLFVAGRLDLVGWLGDLAEQLRLGFVGQRPMGGGITLFLPNVYFRWTLLLVVGAALLVEDRKRAIVVIAAVLATLSTGAILFTVGALVLGSVADSRWKIRPLIRTATWVAVTAGVSLMAVASTPYGEVLISLVAKLSLDSASTAEKVGHIASIVELLRANDAVVLIGSGVGSSFYSRGIDGWVSNVEVSHFNMLRQFGAIYTVAFIGYVARVVLGLLQTDVVGRRLAAGLIMLFVAAGTNPLLLSPVFFFALVIARAYKVRHSHESRNAAGNGDMAAA